MQTTRPRLAPPELLILIGSCLFICVLWLAACFQPEIRWLHFFQAWMYLAAIGLSLRGNRWGYFIGVSAAGLWDYGNLFVTTFFRNGLRCMFAWIATGHLQHAGQIIAVPAWIANALVVAGSVWAYTRLPEKRRGDSGRLALAFVLTTAFFAASMAIFQPRYLWLFRGIFHPHRPW